MKYVHCASTARTRHYKMSDKTKQIDTGGSVYPRPISIDQVGDNTQFKFETGITLRDHFAGNAPTMPEQWWNDTKSSYGSEIGSYAEAISAWNYFYADAMIAARKEQA